MPTRDTLIASQSPHNKTPASPRRPESKGRQRAGRERPQGGGWSRRHTHQDHGSAAVPSLCTIPPTCQEPIPIIEIAPITAVHEVDGASAARFSSAPVAKRQRLVGLCELIARRSVRTPLMPGDVRPTPKQSQALTHISHEGWCIGGTDRIDG